MTPIRDVKVVESRKNYIAHLLAVALLWSLVMTLDYHAQVADANERAESMTSQMAECLNGTCRGVDNEGTYVGCLKAETNKKGN